MSSYLTSLWSVDSANEAPHEEARVGEINVSKVSLNRRHTAAVESKIQVQYNTHKIPFQQQVESRDEHNTHKVPFATKSNVRTRSPKKKGGVTKAIQRNAPPSEKRVQSMSRALKELQEDRVKIQEFFQLEKQDLQKQLQMARAEASNADAEKEELEEELQRARQEKITFQQGFERLQGELKAIQEEKACMQFSVKRKAEEFNRKKQEMEQKNQELFDENRALSLDYANKLHEMERHNQELVDEKKSLLQEVEGLQQALFDKSRESSKRLNAVMAGQEQLEKALDMVNKQNRPWWQLQCS